MITKNPPREHTLPLFKQMNILTLYDQIKLDIASYMYKRKNTADFQVREHRYFTRQRDIIYLPRHDLTKFEHSLSYAGPKLWNSLSNNLKSKLNIHAFRRNYKKKKIVISILIWFNCIVLSI